MISVPKEPVTVSQYVRQCYAREKPLAESTIEQLAITARVFERWAGRPVPVNELTDELVSSWVLDMEQSDRSPATVACQRKNLLALWRSAWETGDTETRPRRVRKVRVPVTIPEAWTPAEVAQLVAATQTVNGYLPNGIRGFFWWRAFILISWDTGLRLGDVLTLRRDQVEEDGTFTLLQEKSGWPHICYLQQPTREALAETFPPEREILLPWPFDRGYFYRTFRELVKTAGIKQGSSKWLRRSSATAVERMRPGAGALHLGHRVHGSVAHANYLDPRQLQQNRPLPPALRYDAECMVVKSAVHPPYRKALTAESVLPPDRLSDVMRRILTPGNGEIDVDDLRAILDTLGIRHRDFAGWLGIHHTMLSYILTGKSRLSARVAEAVRREVEILLHWFTDGQKVQVPS